MSSDRDKTHSESGSALDAKYEAENQAVLELYDAQSLTVVRTLQGRCCRRWRNTRTARRRFSPTFRRGITFTKEFMSVRQRGRARSRQLKRRRAKLRNASRLAQLRW